MDELERLSRRCARERKARKEAETLLEEKSLAFTELNQELMQLATSLKIREELMSSILEAAGEGIYGVDQEGLTTFINPAGAAMLGYSPEDIIGRIHHELAHHSRQDGTAYPQVECPIYSAFRDGKIHRVDDEVFWRADGSCFPVEYVSTPIFEDGEPRGAVISFNDITERKQAEKEQMTLEVQLRQAQKLEAIGQLAAGIAHEINTPIQFIGDNTHFLLEAFGDIEKLVASQNQLIEAAQEGEIPDGIIAKIKRVAEEVDLEFLKEEVPLAIQQSLEGIDRVSKIVRAMKEFSHASEEAKSALDLNSAIQSTITISRNEWKYVAELETDLDPNLPLVPCLQSEFNQVILNVIINAAHAISDVVGNNAKSMGLIRVCTRRDGDWVEITISDTGTGIPEEICSRIFDPFFTTKGVGKGTGQGLTIAYGVVVDKHAGTIKVESKVGVGTTFIIRLPITG